LSGKKNSFSAVLYPEGREKDALYTIEGRWNEEFTIKDTTSKHGTVVDSFNHKKNKTSQLVVTPVEQQDPLESRRAWGKVAAAIGKGDLNATSYEKTLIENRQREMRKSEKEEGREWERIFFSRTNQYANIEALTKKIPGESVEADKTNGVWVFDDRKAANARPPYRPGAMP